MSFLDVRGSAICSPSQETCRMGRRWQEGVSPDQTSSSLDLVISRVPQRLFPLPHISGRSLRKARPDGSGRGLQCKLEAWRILNGMDVQKFWRATAARFKMPVRLGAFLLLGRTAANFEPNLTHFQPKTKEERQQLCYVRHVLTAKYIRPYFFGVA